MLVTILLYVLLNQIYESFFMLKLLENMCKICNETLYVVVYNTIKFVNTIKSSCYIMKQQYIDGVCNRNICNITYSSLKKFLDQKLKTQIEAGESACTYIIERIRILRISIVASLSIPIYKSQEAYNLRKHSERASTNLMIS